jgi:hypothetical protein
MYGKMGEKVRWSEVKYLLLLIYPIFGLAWTLGISGAFRGSSAARESTHALYQQRERRI